MHLRRAFQTSTQKQDDGCKEVALYAGDKIKLTTDDAFKEKCTADTVYLDYKNLPKVLEVGKRVYIDDGLISVRAGCVDVSAVSADVYTVHVNCISRLAQSC